MTRYLTTVVALASSVWALDNAAAPGALTLTVGRGTVIDCPDGVSRLATSSPDVVDAVVASDGEVLFHAKGLGQATLIVWSKNGSRRVFDVTVEPNLDPLRALMQRAFPGEVIDVQGTRDSLALVGKASSQSVADRALALVSSSVKGAVSNLQVAPLPVERQVVLRVRFAELNRSAAFEFGMSLISTGAARTPGVVTTGQFPSASANELSGQIPANGRGTTKFTLSDMLNIFAFRPDLNLGVLIRDLQTRGLLQILAEPNLIATNGKEASFLAGGEFPVPIAQGGANAGSITVQFREFGIRLSFLPQITAHHTIRLHVKPEVSTIDAANGITVAGFRIPALATRRVETDVELAEGQSFVIAGLLDERVMQDLARIPGLAHIPLIGQIFRSRSESKGRTELMIVVTPEAGIPLSVGAPVSDMLPQMPAPFMPPVQSKNK